MMEINNFCKKERSVWIKKTLVLWCKINSAEFWGKSKGLLDSGDLVVVVQYSLAFPFYNIL